VWHKRVHAFAFRAGDQAEDPDRSDAGAIQGWYFGVAVEVMKAFLHRAAPEVVAAQFVEFARGARRGFSGVGLQQLVDGHRTGGGHRGF
jgi:hypothetical protein